MTTMTRGFAPPLWLWLGWGLCSVSAPAEPIAFSIPTQRGDRALALFTQQSGVDILYTAHPLRQIRSQSVHGLHEPSDALVVLLRGTGFMPTQQNGRYAIVAITPPPGSLVGRIEPSNGESATSTTVHLLAEQRTTSTNRHGEYRFENVRPGTYRIVAERDGFRTLEISDNTVQSNRRTQLALEIISPRASVTEFGQPQLQRLRQSGRDGRRARRLGLPLRSPPNAQPFLPFIGARNVARFGTRF